MSKTKFEMAKELIRDKEYDDARALLETIDHPTAKKWLDQLSTIEKRNPATVADKPAVSTPMINYAFVGLLSGAISLIVGLLIGAFVLQRPAANTNNQSVDSQPNALSGCWAQQWWEEAEPVIIEFLDTAEIATSTSRGSLSPILSDLRQVHRTFERLDYPDCMSDIRSNTNSGMNQAAEGFNSFLGQSEAVSGVQFSLATQYFADAYEELLNEWIGQGILPDTRMANTAVFIWGGDEPTQAAEE